MKIWLASAFRKNYKQGVEPAHTKGFEEMRGSFLGVLVSVLVLSGCGFEEFREPRKIDRDLQPILNLYLLHAPNEGRLDDLRVLKFGGMRLESDAGTCEKSKQVVPVLKGTLWTDFSISVYRDPEFSNSWKRIVLHELGHCLHGLDHSSNPDDIMYGGEDERPEFWDEHLIERLDAMFEKSSFKTTVP